MGNATLRTGRGELVFLHDVAMAALSVPLSLYLRLGDRLLPVAGEVLLLGWPIFVLVAAIVFRLSGLHRAVWRYASVGDLLAILRAATLAILVFLPVLFLVSRLEGMPRSVLVINWLVLVVLLGAPRLAYRALREGGLAGLLERQALRVPALLVGTGDAAESFLRGLARNRAAPFRVVALIDTEGGRAGRRIHGVPVAGELAALPAVLARLRAEGLRPQRLILADERLDRAALAGLFDLAEAEGLALARLPRLTELSADDADAAAALRPVAVEDLLGRPRTVLDTAPMRRMIEGRRILVTGAGGSIGGELARQIAAYAPARLALLDHSELLLCRIERELAAAPAGPPPVALLADLRDRARIEQLLGAERPDLVFHAAALKHVPVAEAHPCEAVLTNVVGTRNLAEACRTAGVAGMVCISTDKAVNPASVLGATKRLAERFCQALDGDAARRPGATRFVVVRFGNVLGSTGSVLPLFQEQLAAGGPLTVTHPDMCRYFMTVREACALVLAAAALGTAADAPPGRLFVLEMGEPVRILDLARQLLRLSGKDPAKEVPIVFTGIRPGEKLREELFHAHERPLPTPVAGLLVAEGRAADRPILGSLIDELEAAARAGRTAALQALLRRAVPEYRPPAAAAASA